LKDLEAAHESFLSRVRVARRGRATVLEYAPVRKPRCFDVVPYQRAGRMPPRSWAVFELPDGVAFRQEGIVEVAAMLRSLACDEKRYRNRDDFREQFPDVDPEVYLAGHLRVDRALRIGPTPPRFSYLPLPSIGHEHADGMIRRLLIAEPFGGTGAQARWAQRRLRGQALRDKDGQERGVLLDLWRRSSAAAVERYVGESRTWATVTPVILPGFDDARRFRGIPASGQNRPTKAERLFFKAVQQAGLSLEALRDITLRKAPYWAGSRHPDLYRRPDYLDAAKNRRFSAWHVHLVFRDSVRGPLSIGAGRHCGLGLFAVWPM
jgi:CRISPR-associated protein Csb2